MSNNDKLLPLGAAKKTTPLSTPNETLTKILGANGEARQTVKQGYGLLVALASTLGQKKIVLREYHCFG